MGLSIPFFHCKTSEKRCLLVGSEEKEQETKREEQEKFQFPFYIPKWTQVYPCRPQYTLLLYLKPNQGFNGGSLRTVPVDSLGSFGSFGSSLQKHDGSLRHGYARSSPNPTS